MGLNEAVKSCFRQYGTFTGRARRAEFWMFYLFMNIVAFVSGILIMVAAFVLIVPATVGQGPAIGALIAYFVVVGLALLVNLALLVPYLAVSARRLHDMGQTGNWLWLNLAGLGVVPAIMAFFDSQWGPNRWGHDPKAAERAAYGAPGMPGAYHATPGYPPPPAY